MYSNKEFSLTGSICTAGVSRFRITPDGVINPCEMIRDINLGNIYEENFIDIINGGARKVWIKEFDSIVNTHKCNQCEDRNICNFCPGLFKVETKSFYEPSKYTCLNTSIKKILLNKGGCNDSIKLQGR